MAVNSIDMKSNPKMKWLKNIIVLVAFYVIMQVLISLNIINDYYQVTIAMICINIILAVSLNLITGFTGQFSLGHAGFMSIGAYTCALFTLNMSQQYSYFIGIFAGAVMAAIIGALIGIPTLRLKGDYLAIATLGLSEIIRIIILNFEFTGGASGLSDIPQYTNWTWLFVFTAGTVIIINNFIRSSHGRACISIREDEIAAEASGINTTKYKVLAFVIGAFFAGIAGALYSSYFYFVKPDIFGFLKSIDILVIVVLGGMGSISGSILAAVLLAIISAYLQAFPDLRMVIYSILLVIIMIFRPQGLMGTKELSLNSFLKKRPAKVE
ncbi:MAG TPA: branched-chain amino acid ABC transporter permease [Clostridiales bacterium]|nr:branched-chain amino acid ABC transporter permease [Clostridiales bacterium]